MDRNDDRDGNRGGYDYRVSLNNSVNLFSHIQTKGYSMTYIEFVIFRIAWIAMAIVIVIAIVMVVAIDHVVFPAIVEPHHNSCE